MNNQNPILPVVGYYSFVLNIDGYLLRLTYSYNPFCDLSDKTFLQLHDFGEEYHTAHFELRGKTASETGYRSSFVKLSQMEGDPYGFAIQLANHFYEEVKESHPKIFSPQLELF